MHGRSVVIEWGSWARRERDALRRAARNRGAGVELHFLDEPIEVLWGRVKRRALEGTFGSRATTFDDLKAWSASFERPTVEEMALFDPPPGGSTVI